MDLINLIHIIHRWQWPVLALMVVTGLVLGFRLATGAPANQAQVKLQLTAPQQEDVTLFNGTPSTTLRDEMTIARNNFVELLQSREVYDRASKQLALKDITYVVNVRTVLDSDFIYVTVTAPNVPLAEQISNAHVLAAIAYYGEVRAKPATSTKNFLADQLQGADKDLRAAQQALTTFYIQNSMTGLDNDQAEYQRLIDQLELQRDQRLLEGPTSLDIKQTEVLLQELQLERERASAASQPTQMQRLDEAIARYHVQLATLIKNTSATSDIDRVLAQRRDQLAHIVMLGPQSSELQANVKQAQSAYQLLRDKYTEALLKENNIKAASSIQVVEPALAPPQPSLLKLFALWSLAVAGSFGLGVMLAFILEALSGLKESAHASTASSAPGTARTGS